jgi:hypothetical protein
MEDDEREASIACEDRKWGLTMREMDAFEQAYKNGFAAGLKAAEEKIVHCKECKWFDCDDVFCKVWLKVAGSNDFCSYGERREDG